MSFMIAAAGTGGHVFPGLAVGDALVASGVNRDEIMFIGGTRLDATSVPSGLTSLKEVQYFLKTAPFEEWVQSLA